MAAWGAVSVVAVWWLGARAFMSVGVTWLRAGLASGCCASVGLAAGAVLQVWGW